MKLKIQNADLFLIFGIPVIGIPLVYINSTIDPVLLPRFLVLAISLLLVNVCFLVKLIISGFDLDVSLLRRALFPALLGYLVFSAISLASAINLAEGIFELLKSLLSALFLFSTVIIISNDKKRLHTLLHSVAIIALLLSIPGFLRFSFTDFNLGGLKIFPEFFGVESTMANRNLFTSFLMMSLPFALYGLVRFSGFWRLIHGISFSIIIFNIVVLQTRAVWVAILFSSLVVIVVAAVFFRRFKLSSKAKSFYFKRLIQIAGIAAIVLIISLLSYSNDKIQYSISERLSSITTFEHKSVSERLELWQKTISMIRDNPLSGVGIGNWKLAFPGYGTAGLRSESGAVHFQRPHNDYLWILAETGIGGLVFYLTAFAIVIIYGLKILRHSRDTEDKFLALAMLFGILGYMVVACFSYPKERIVHAIFLMLLIGIILSIYHSVFPIKKTPSRALRLLVLSFSLAILMLSIWVGYARLHAEMHTKKAIAAWHAGDWKTVIEEVENANTIFYEIDPTSAPLSWYKGVANFSLNRKDQAFENFRKAYKVHPNHIHVLNNLATCYELAGEHDTAIPLYERALQISPAFDDARINLGASCFNAGRYQHAYDTLLKCNDSPKKLHYLNIVKTKLNIE
ncbi:O-antigen ligase family protein [candidate division KSB1 bacterium]|nr:O-antigen ligase family protein [candidate division KSB1 bacterium]